jgi:hypothetical protein
MSSLRRLQPFVKGNGRSDDIAAGRRQNSPTENERFGGEGSAQLRTVFVIAAAPVGLELCATQLQQPLMIDTIDHKLPVLWMIVHNTVELSRGGQPPAPDTQIDELTTGAATATGPGSDQFPTAETQEKELQTTAKQRSTGL